MPWLLDDCWLDWLGDDLGWGVNTFWVRADGSTTHHYLAKGVTFNDAVALRHSALATYARA